MNVLLTSIGRRSYLAAYFRNALGSAGQVVTTNTDRHSAGMHAGDKAFVVPSSNHPSYIDSLLEICVREEIGLICSLHDLDVLVLARHQDRFRQVGAIPVLPSPEWAELCLDKYACALTLARHGFRVPWQTTSLAAAIEAITRKTVRFPLIVKARHGFGSLGLNVSECLDDLRMHVGHARRQIARSPVTGFVETSIEESVLIQEYLTGPEYCLDVVNNLAGVYECEFACEVHAMRSGESDSATTVDPAMFGDTGRRLSALVKCRGIMGADLIMSSDGPAIIELNPRFTGDYPYQHLAGADIPAVLVAWRNGTPVPRQEWLAPRIGIRGYKDIVPKVETNISSPDSQEAARSSNAAI